MQTDLAICNARVGDRNGQENSQWPSNILGQLLCFSIQSLEARSRPFPSALRTAWEAPASRHSEAARDASSCLSAGCAFSSSQLREASASSSPRDQEEACVRVHGECM
ncbi:hypothetical protein SRHO_G00302700 [Serrasalmus rhombeus]